MGVMESSLASIGSSLEYMRRNVKRGRKQKADWQAVAAAVDLQFPIQGVWPSAV
jgi:hypothetical protein